MPHEWRVLSESQNRDYAFLRQKRQNLFGRPPDMKLSAVFALDELRDMHLETFRRAS
jgi:hypothetical protein